MAREFDIKIDRDLLNLSRNARKGMINGLADVGDRVQTEIVKLPQADSYVDRTGNLRASILRGSVKERDLTVTITAHKEYGIFVNDGTRYIRPRQFMEKGFNKVVPKMERIFKSHLDKVM